MTENKSLLIQEIDEEVRAERLRQWWQRFGSWVVGLCMLAVLATIGYQFDRNRRMEANQQVTSAIVSSNDALERGQYAAAAKQLTETPSHADAVTLLARLKAAQAFQQAGDTKAAIVQYEAVAKNTASSALASYAKLQLGQYDTMKEDAPFALLAQELQAVKLYQQGKKDEAAKLLQAIQADPEAPSTARHRAAELEAAFQ